MVEAMKTAYSAGKKSKETPASAAAALKDVEHELHESIKQFVGSTGSDRLGAPLGLFANVASAVWELAWWKGAASSDKE